jgi:hypothetical protein
MARPAGLQHSEQKSQISENGTPARAAAQRSKSKIFENGFPWQGRPQSALLA